MAGTMNVFLSSRESAASPIFAGRGSSGCPGSHLSHGGDRGAQTIGAGARPPGRRRRSREPPPLPGIGMWRRRGRPSVRPPEPHAPRARVCERSRLPFVSVESHGLGGGCRLGRARNFQGGELCVSGGRGSSTIMLWEMSPPSAVPASPGLPLPCPRNGASPQAARGPREALPAQHGFLCVCQEH